MKRNLGNALGTLGALALVFGAIGCGATTYQPLEKLRANYEQTRSNEAVANKAPIALHEAENALVKAEQEWQETGDQREVDHLVYIANQRLEIARVRTQQVLAQEKIKTLSDERDKILLQARSQEAARAQLQAAVQKRATQAALSRAANAEALAAQEKQAARERKMEAENARVAAAAAQARAEDTAAQARKLEEQLSELQARVKETPRGVVLTLGDVLFEFDKSDIKPGAMRNLYPLVRFLEQNDGRQVVIEGHTDAIGSDSYNLDLSERRAKAVQNFLIQNGIAPARITARGLGEEYPVATNDSAAGRQQNRRVEIEILKSEPRVGANPLPSS